MSLSASFDSPVDRRAYAIVAAGAAALSYVHARAYFVPFMGSIGGSVTPLMLDAMVYWLASASIRQAQHGRPLRMLSWGAGFLLGLAVTANALGGLTWPQRVFLALPAALFGFLVVARQRLALYQFRAANGDERIRLRLWLRHPVKAARAWLWLARQSAPAFDRATAERDQLRAARAAVLVALPGRASRKARATVLRELAAGRLPAAAAVTASGLMTRPGVPALHRAALAASLGGGLPDTWTDTSPDGTPDTIPDTAPATQADTIPASAPRPKRTPDRTSRRTTTAAAVAKIRDRHPDMPAADIARRLGVTDRTVRRHLAPSVPESIAA